MSTNSNGHNSIPNMLVSRLYLNLKAYDGTRLPSHARHGLFTEWSSESRVLGNIGAPLHFPGTDEDDIDANGSEG